MKIYCGVADLPDNHKLGTALECAKKSKIALYGKYKADSKLIKLSVSKQPNLLKNMEKKLTGLVAKLTKVRKDLNRAKERSKIKKIPQEEREKYLEQVKVLEKEEKTIITKGKTLKKKYMELKELKEKQSKKSKKSKGSKKK